MAIMFARFFLILLATTSLLLAASAAPKVVDDAAYRAQLQSARDALERMEDGPSRPLGQVLKPLDQSQTVRRSDGATQTVEGDEWARRAGEVNGTATRAQVKSARESIERRLSALDEWRQNRDFAAADAQRIVDQLEASGQIRTGPTASQKWWADLMRRLGNWWNGLSSPLSGAVPQVGLNLSYILLGIGAVALIVLCLLLVRYLMSQSGRNKSKAKRHFEGEDADLLLLPPDELRERARRLAEQGDYREALRHLYISLLLRLDSGGVWRYDTRRTNWEHIGALQKGARHGKLVAPLSDLTRRFDRVRYGNAVCEAPDWRSFERDASEFETMLL